MVLFIMSHVKQRRKRIKIKIYHTHLGLVNVIALEIKKKPKTVNAYHDSHRTKQMRVYSARLSGMASRVYHVKRSAQWRGKK